MRNLAHLHITLSEELKQKLEEEAYRKGFNLSTYVRQILIEALKKE
jgi:predicted DNA-binding protein